MNNKTDFLIIGGGVSGLTLASKLSELVPDAEILLITKEGIKECNTFYAQGGIASVYDENDDFKKHIKDTLIAGDGLLIIFSFLKPLGVIFRKWTSTSISTAYE